MLYCFIYYEEGQLTHYDRMQAYSFLFFSEYISDIQYYEVLDTPLPELQCLKTLKFAFHHATKDEVILEMLSVQLCSSNLKAFHGFITLFSCFYP